MQVLKGEPINFLLTIALVRKYGLHEIWEISLTLVGLEPQ